MHQMEERILFFPIASHARAVLERVTAALFYIRRRDTAHGENVNIKMFNQVEFNETSLLLKHMCDLNLNY